MTDAEKLRKIAEWLGFGVPHASTGTLEVFIFLRRIADLLDAVPPETLCALGAKEPTREMIHVGAQAIIALTRTVDTHSVKPTIDEIEKMMNEAELPNINMAADGTIIMSRPVVVTARMAAEVILKAALFSALLAAAPAKPEG